MPTAGYAYANFSDRSPALQIATVSIQERDKTFLQDIFLAELHIELAYLNELW
ncbi:hypothetical protein [Nostoc sp.]|uniref:hypothetical protein n=1 Tax=Nostoc sp. TaxID=1180 RepID=UPI002FFA8896